MRWVLVLALATVGSIAQAAPLDPALQAELKRGVAAAAHRTSDEPAMRTERLLHEPSPGFALGAALGAWTNAAETLDYDLKTPSGDGNDAETIHLDCFDEMLMMSHLETRRQALGLSPAQVIATAGSDAALLPAWTRRQAGPLKACL